MNQQEKLIKCAEVLGYKENHISDFRNRLEILVSNPVAIQELVTTLGIAVWQDNAGVWFSANNVIDRSLTAKSVILDYPEFFFHKDYSQAVIDCVAGGKSE